MEMLEKNAKMGDIDQEDYMKSGQLLEKLTSEGQMKGKEPPRHNQRCGMSTVKSNVSEVKRKCNLVHSGCHNKNSINWVAYQQ